MKCLRRRCAALYVGLAAFIIVACGSNEPPPRPAAPPGSTPVEFQLDWAAMPEYIGYVMADVLGYYAEKNLDVRMLEGGGAVMTAQDFIEGSADIGTCGTYTLVGEVLKRTGPDGVYTGPQPRIAAIIFEKNPSVIVLGSNKSANSPEDLAGMRIGYPSKLAQAYRQLNALLEQDPALAQQVKLEEFFLQGEQQLRSGKIDGLASYLMDIPANLEADGVPFNLVMLSDWGMDTPSQALIVGANSSLDPETLEKFVEASLEGWEYVRRNPENAIDLFAAQYPDQNRERIRVVVNQCLDMLPQGTGTAAYRDRAAIQSGIERTLKTMSEDERSKVTGVNLATFVNGFVQE